MTKGIKITIFWVAIILIVLAINYATKGKLPFYILGFIGVVALIIGTIYFIRKEETPKIA